MGKGFLPQAFATALAEFGCPILLANSLYVRTEPSGILSIAAHTFFSKFDVLDFKTLVLTAALISLLLLSGCHLPACLALF